MATKEAKRQAKGLIEKLEARVHVGPPIGSTEVLSAQEFLRQNDFSPASDYFERLAQIKTRLQSRPLQPAWLPGKRNYGGCAAGRWMQLQSAYDHIILSTCYEGQADGRFGRLKLSHRFNQEGRIDFVESKFLRSLTPCLDGERRKLLNIKEYQNVRRDWHATQAFVLPILPRELLFLYAEVFRSARPELLAWLINIGHRLVADLLTALRQPAPAEEAQRPPQGEQLALEALSSDEVALPILKKAQHLEAAVELQDEKSAVVRYVHC